MQEVVTTFCSFILGFFVPWWVIRKDLRHLAPTRLARAWNEASFLAAVLAFGPLAVCVHFTKTRASFIGFWLGIAWAAITIGLIAGGVTLCGLLWSWLSGS